MRKKHIFFSFFYNFFYKLKNSSGAAILEFCLILPTLLLLLTGLVEISNLTYTSQKNQTAASTASNLVVRLTKLDTTEINDIGRAVESFMGNLIQSGDFGIVITIIQQSGASVSPPDGPIPYVVYQQRYGKQSLTQSKFSYTRGSIGQDVDTHYVTRNAVDPALIYNHTFLNNEQIVIIESTSLYKPIFNKEYLENMTLSYETHFETPAQNVHQGRFRFLPNSNDVIK